MGMAPDGESKDVLLRLASDIVTAYVSKNTTSANDLPQILRSVHATLSALNGNAVDPLLKPAVPIKRSVTNEYVVCLEDGKKLKMLKRYLRTNYNLSPEDYRAKWGLPADYPMVAPNYAARRSAFAKEIGLGKRPGKSRRR